MQEEAMKLMSRLRRKFWMSALRRMRWRKRYLAPPNP
jgi:hypothetical protein